MGRLDRAAPPKLAYDLRGDVVNTVSRMESGGVPGSIQVSAATNELRGKFICNRRGVISIKGKGGTWGHILVSRRPAAVQRLVDSWELTPSSTPGVARPWPARSVELSPYSPRLPIHEIVMQAGRSFALAALPGAAAIAVWGAYRHTVNELSIRWAVPLHLHGEVRTLPTAWGRLSYRLVTGTDPAPPLVLVHGWGSSADSMWWQLIGKTDRTTLVVDLPGHGRSLLEAPFSFDLAAEAVTAAIADAGLTRPILVGHSMGGPVSLTVLRQSGEHDLAGFVAIATSAYWVRPRLQIMAAAAPYLLAPASPITVGAQRARLRRDSEPAARTAEADLRPSRRVLEESAIELKRFDARGWRGFRIPSGVWIVTLNDGVIAPDDQRSSASHFGIPVVELPSDHPVVMRDPEAVAGIIERSAHTWADTAPTELLADRLGEAVDFQRLAKAIRSVLWNHP